MIFYLLGQTFYDEMTYEIHDDFTLHLFTVRSGSLVYYNNDVQGLIHLHADPLAPSAHTLACDIASLEHPHMTPPQAASRLSTFSPRLVG